MSVPKVVTEVDTRFPSLSICQVPTPDADFASCGEDGCLKVWKDGACTQTIDLPCTSVWALCAR